MALVTDNEVKEIISTDLTDLSAFIEVADLIVQEQLNDQGLTALRLKEIERWLAAHFVAMREDSARLAEEQVGDTRARYNEGKLGQFLESTRFGQQALLLDTSGQLFFGGKGKFVFDSIPTLVT